MGKVWIARSAKRHKQSRTHIEAALRNAGQPEVIGEQLHYIGTDDRGVELHIIAVPDRTPGDLLVIHAMPTAWKRGK